MHSTGQINIKDLDNISVTAYRIISIFNMLLENPCSDKDINENLQNDIVGSKSLSQDTICIYMNTLRILGCIISRPSRTNNYKYVLKSHPFKIELSDDEMDFLIEIKKILSVSEDWKLMLNIDNLINNILNNLPPEHKKKFLQRQKSVLRNVEISNQIQLINLLEQYCAKKRTLFISYYSSDENEKSFEITVDKLSYENGALYLWGYNQLIEEVQCLRVDRIREVKIVSLRSKKALPTVVTIRYKLTGLSAKIYSASEDERIIEKNEDDVIIEVKTKSKFKIMQRVLAYGADCTVLNPLSFRNDVLNKLKLMLSSYNIQD